HTLTHARTHARTHSRTHARTHARTHTHTHTHTYTQTLAIRKRALSSHWQFSSPFPNVFQQQRLSLDLRPWTRHLTEARAVTTKMSEGRGRERGMKRERKLVT